MSDRVDVAVVGAGPAGLALALGLARAGRSVLVLEREPSTAEHSRAPAIWPRTQEMLADLGVLDRFFARGLRLERVRLADADRGGVLLALPMVELEGETPFPWLLIVPQSVTERLLLEALRSESSARVLFSREVVGVEATGRSVRLRHRVSGDREGGGREDGGAEEVGHVEAAFAVGCDGAHSTVREALGADFEGETYGTRAALADLRLRDDRDLAFPRLSTRSGVAIGIRIDADLWRLILPFSATGGREGRPPLAERVERAARGLFPEVRSREDYETVWQSEFRLHRRLSSRLVAGRVALAGDAAHLNSPVGGQGMNAAIQDAAALTNALSRALGADTPELLEGYAERRRRAIEGGVNPFTDRLTRLLLFREGRAIRPVLRAADLLLRIRPLRRRFLRRIAMLD